MLITVTPTESKTPNVQIHLVAEFHGESGGSEICSDLILQAQNAHKDVKFMIEWHPDYLQGNQAAAALWAQNRNLSPSETVDELKLASPNAYKKLQTRDQVDWDFAKGMIGLKQHSLGCM